MVPQIFPSLRENSIDDFEPVRGDLAWCPVVLIVSKNVRANTMKEFIEEMRSEPPTSTLTAAGVG